jgi:hypothetical protein
MEDEPVARFDMGIASEKWVLATSLDSAASEVPETKDLPAARCWVCNLGGDDVS